MKKSLMLMVVVLLTMFFTELSAKDSAKVTKIDAISVPRFIVSEMLRNSHTVASVVCYGFRETIKNSKAPITGEKVTNKIVTNETIELHTFDNMDRSGYVTRELVAYNHRGRDGLIAKTRVGKIVELKKGNRTILINSLTNMIVESDFFLTGASDASDGSNSTTSTTVYECTQDLSPVLKNIGLRYYAR